MAGRPVRDEVLVVEALAGGEKRWLSVNTTPVLDDFGNVQAVVTIHADVGERERHRAALEAARDAAVARWRASWPLRAAATAAQASARDPVRRRSS